MRKFISTILWIITDWLTFITKKKYYSKNFEKVSEYYLPKEFYKNRKVGLSAMMRLKNEEEWIFFAIQSIIEYVDEIVIVLQNSTDNTRSIIENFNSPKIKIYDFPFSSFPAGQYHKNYLKSSIFNLAYYYNFALSKTSYTYVWKWDGDHAAYEIRAKEIREIIDKKSADIIHYFGYDIFGQDLKHLCKDPFCTNEPAIFRVSKKTFYISGKKCEEFSYPKTYGLKKTRIYNYPEPLFIHFKYAKGLSSIGKGWITDWTKDPTLKSIRQRKQKGSKFTDDYPLVIKNFYFANKN